MKLGVWMLFIKPGTGFDRLREDEARGSESAAMYSSGREALRASSFGSVGLGLDLAVSDALRTAAESEHTVEARVGLPVADTSVLATRPMLGMALDDFFTSTD